MDVRTGIINACFSQNDIRQGKFEVPDLLVHSLGYTLSVLLFGTAASAQGAFKESQAKNFREAAKSLLEQHLITWTSSPSQVCHA